MPQPYTLQRHSAWTPRSPSHPPQVVDGVGARYQDLRKAPPELHDECERAGLGVLLSRHVEVADAGVQQEWNEAMPLELLPDPVVSRQLRYQFAAHAGIRIPHLRKPQRQ
eukprot:CAMPEP_0114120302 /NCGR_PEP_ID=MMETSP0043_2-20121206/6576_1 /TAXON_ID=464988 /ORGANISM="Hemiselmis andersenii, Strain CCMP644" /LENGTH=109 /DNA_ID=CAMNT_0001212915 /DNA_START=269 /DNA_END=596 /DNA_ORIENTATION=-